MRVFAQASLAGLLAMLVSVTPMVMGIVYAFSPTEHRLALMRPLSPIRFNKRRSRSI